MSLHKQQESQPAAASFAANRLTYLAIGTSSKGRKKHVHVSGKTFTYFSQNTYIFLERALLNQIKKESKSATAINKRKKIRFQECIFRFPSPLDKEKQKRLTFVKKEYILYSAF